MGTSDDRMEAAVDAAANAFHDICRERGQLHWESTSPRWREQMRGFVRPLVVAALEAADRQNAPDSTSEFENGRDACS